MATKKPTTKAHRGFIHIPKRGGGRPQIPRNPFRPRRPRRPIGDPFNPFRPRRPRIPRFPFGRGRLGPADEPLDRRGRPIPSPIQGGRRRPRTDPRGVPIGIRPTVPDRLPLMPTGKSALDPRNRALMERQLRELANRRRRTTGTPTPQRRRRRKTPQITAGLGSLGSSIFNRAARAQRRAKGGMVFKSKDYVNPSNITDNKKK
jgi:hypothetical protein